MGEFDQLDIKNFVVNVLFNDQVFNISDLEFFKNPETQLQCFRFNGARNKQLATTNNTLDKVIITVRNSQLRYSSEEVKVFDFFPQTKIFITDNYLNSLHSETYLLSLLTYLEEVAINVTIGKSMIETKLGEPYNHCKESPPDQRYHQMNCIESCIYRDIAYKYNCSFDGLFRIEGLVECSQNIQEHRDEFYNSCKNECPKSCAWTEYSKTEPITEYVKNFEPSVSTLTRFIFSVEFSSLEISQIPKMTGFSYISNIGGSLGLFMGISFLSFVELIEFFIDVVFLIFKHK